MDSVSPQSAAKLTLIVCQLHGGDIGVSSKSGEGSTFGFYFKVRLPSSSPRDSRPPFSTRSSDSSNAPQRSQTPRPSYSRNNSNLKRIKELEKEQGTSEKTNKDKELDTKNQEKPKSKEEKPRSKEERPGIQTLTSNAGVDSEDLGMNDSLTNPPTEYRPEAHPHSFRDGRYEETEKVADKIDEQTSPLTDGMEPPLPDLRRGETKRQESHSLEQSKSHSQEPSDTRSTLLLVEDNMINQKVLRRQLQGKGFEVSFQHNLSC